MSQVETSRDTQAVLLLTVRFRTQSSESSEPLSQGEYNRLAVAMAAASLRPADLLTDAGDAFVRDEAAHSLEASRLRDLLERSMALAITLESWGNGGFWVMSRGDELYPERLQMRLKGKAPALLFGCGEPSLLDQGGLAIVGARNVDDRGSEFASSIARAATAEGIHVVSGGARGVDSIAMEAALESDGTVLGVLANDLARTSRSATAREAIQDDRLCLVSPFHPETRFEAWRAMDRNKSIYALSDWAVVVASDLRKGGTWAGARENLDHGWVPLFARGGDGAPAGNEALIGMGAVALTTEQLPELKSILASTESSEGGIGGTTNGNGSQLPLFQ